MMISLYALIVIAIIMGWLTLVVRNIMFHRKVKRLLASPAVTIYSAEGQRQLVGEHIVLIDLEEDSLETMQAKLRGVGLTPEAQRGGDTWPLS